MNSNTIKGSAKKAGGAVQEAAGKLVGNPKLQAKGKMNQALGSMQKTAGKIEDAVDE